MLQVVFSLASITGLHHAERQPAVGSDLTYGPFLRLLGGSKLQFEVNEASANCLSSTSESLRSCQVSENHQTSSEACRHNQYDRRSGPPTLMSVNWSARKLREESGPSFPKACKRYSSRQRSALKSLSGTPGTLGMFAISRLRTMLAATIQLITGEDANTRRSAWGRLIFCTCVSTTALPVTSNLKGANQVNENRQSSQQNQTNRPRAPPSVATATKQTLTFDQMSSGVSL